jgi:hypothetical protein
MIAEITIDRMAKTIKYVTPVPYGSATGQTAEVYQQMLADFLPDDLSWAAANPAVAGAFARFAAVIEEAGKRIVPEQVRVLVSERVQAWNGEAMGISRRWVEEVVVEIKEEHRTAARLALLTAFASYQVDSSVIENFQSHYPGDAQLIAATAWASLTAARRAGVWFAQPFAMAV